VIFYREAPAGPHRCPGSRHAGRLREWHSLNKEYFPRPGFGKNKNKALEKTLEDTASKKILTGTTFSHLEIFTIGKNESLSPSKWQTDIYFPIAPKVVPTPYRKVVKDSTVIAPAPAVNKSQEESEF